MSTPVQGRAPLRRGSVQRGSVQMFGPPVLALIVSSPAIWASLTGGAPPMDAVVVLAASLAVAWTLSAVGLHLTRSDGRERAAYAAERTHNRRSDAAPDPEPAQERVALGRIQPIRVPASEAIPGTPEGIADAVSPTSSTKEGSLA